MALDASHDLGMLKQALVDETNKKSELNKLLREAGTGLKEAKKTVLDWWDNFQKIKNQIRCCEDNIKSLKIQIRSEQECGS